MMRIGLSGRARWTDRTFLEFLEETRQPAEAIDRFWRVVVVSACNLDLHEVGDPVPEEVVEAEVAAGDFHDRLAGGDRVGHQAA